MSSSLYANSRLRAVPLADARTRGEEEERQVEFAHRKFVPRDGALRTWWDVAVLLHEKMGEPMLCAQTIRDTHDRALEKLRKLLSENTEENEPVRRFVHLEEPDLEGDEW